MMLEALRLIESISERNRGKAEHSESQTKPQTHSEAYGFMYPTLFCDFSHFFFFNETHVHICYAKCYSNIISLMERVPF